MKQKLGNYIAVSSVYSRRKAMELVKQGHVRVNNMLITEPWYEIAQGDRVSIDKRPVAPQKHAYFLVNKPSGVLTTMADDQGRLHIAQLLKGASRSRLFPVGRLDKETTGLLLCTNDGALAQRLSHPRYQVRKLYEVTLSKPITADELARLCKGLYLSDGKAAFDRAYLVAKKRGYVVQVELHSGKNRIVRRLFAAIGFQVKKLDRVGYAGLSKRGLSPGKFRQLSADEIAKLRGI